MNAINAGTHNSIAGFFDDTTIIANIESNHHARKIAPTNSHRIKGRK